MRTNIQPSAKASRVIYWISTIWLALGMVSTGIAQLLKAKAGTAGADNIEHMGYPSYFVTIIAIWKILGTLAILLPKFTLVKEWAYAGFFFVMTGAIFSHIASNDPVTEMFPSLLLLVLTLISWYFRPADRRLISIHH
jgi:uncharacterized membrane protein YphA (DoxX/SURF4 family)